jgi:transposase
LGEVTAQVRRPSGFPARHNPRHANDLVEDLGHHARVRPGSVDVIWRTVEPLLPQQVETHPLGCHRPRVPGRVCFRGILIRLAHGNDVRLPTLDPIDQAGLLADIGVLHLDRGYDSPAVRDRLRVAGIDQFEIQRRGTKVPGVKRQPLRLGLRWVVEATNTWWSNYGLAALALLHPISILGAPGDLLQPAREEPLAFGLTAIVVEQQPEHLRWTAEARGRLAVVAAVTYDPGWPATVDDAPVPVRRSGDGLVELDLPAGQHRVDLRFTGARPNPLGVVLTLAGLLALALLRRGGRGSRADRGRPAGPGAAACPG